MEKEKIISVLENGIKSEDRYFNKYDSTLFQRALAWKEAGINVDLEEVKEVCHLIHKLHTKND